MITPYSFEYYFGYGNTIFGHLVELRILFWVQEHDSQSPRQAWNIILVMGTRFSVTSLNSEYYFRYGNTLFSHLVETLNIILGKETRFSVTSLSSEYYFGY